MKKPYVLELFAGGGGAHLGLSAALPNRRHVLVEWDADACATLRAIGDRSLVLESDVRQIDLSPLAGRVHLMWASPPCQCWSQAGSKLGAADLERNLFPASFLVVDDVQPTWLVLENVPGLSHHLKRTCRKGEESAETCPGCYLEHRILPSVAERFAWSAVWDLDAYRFGVPQKRRRLFIVAGPHPRTAPSITHEEPGLARQLGLLPWVTMAEALDLPVVDAEGRPGNRNGQIEPSRAVGTRGNTMVRVVGAGPRPHGKDRAHERHHRDITHEPSPTVAAVRVGNAGPWVEGVLPGPSPTVTATEDKGCATDARRASRPARRRLTTDECAILQDFPAGHPFQGGAVSRYRQIGNAVPPTLARVVSIALATADLTQHEDRTIDLDQPARSV